MGNSETVFAIMQALFLMERKGPKFPLAGICDNVADEVCNEEITRTEVFEILRSFTLQWSKHSGAPLFPVPSPRENLQAMTAFYQLDKWDKTSAYGQARWELVRFLIDSMREYIKCPN